MGTVSIVLLVIYLIFLLLALLYSGIITYHVLKYRSQLPPKESRRALVVWVAYLVVGGIILVISIISAGIGLII